ncbi:hypothetical protein [Alkalihalophilus marmarensis]|uniref:hypothetical protein n=1 Tax=Alkalihalophilus marmarensis TaxID=521377 RepID=UPI002E1B1B13|nr:hypothetical protein [Alkalihalophilus marmarensis]
MKRHFTLLFISILMSGLFFYIFNLSTPPPGSVSGNGNPMLLFIPILVILFVGFIFSMIKVIEHFRVSIRAVTITMMALLLHWLVGLTYQRTAFDNYREVLAEVYQKEWGYVDWYYIEQITSSLLSVHTNKLYFNLNTYIMFLTLSLFLSLAYILVKRYAIMKHK